MDARNEMNPSGSGGGAEGACDAEARRCADMPAPQRAASPYATMTEQEAFESYAAWFRRIRFASIAIVVALGAVAILCVELEWTVAYLVLLLAIIATALVQNVRISKHFLELGKILTEDCDVAKYRAVMERFAARWHRRSTQAVVMLELAFCDWSSMDARGALDHLARSRFRAKSFQWIRWLNIQALALNELGDTAGRDQALAELRARRARVRNGSVIAGRIDTLLHALDLRFGSHDAWTPEDAAFMRDALARADNHFNRVDWYLSLAAYELRYGTRERALMWLDEKLVMPLTPRAARTRAELLERLGASEA